MTHSNIQKTTAITYLSDKVIEHSLYKFHIIQINDPRRKDTEKFITEQFAKAHKAIINNFMPSLLIITNLKGDIKAAIGIRNASQDSLFLEHYFDQPIEHILSKKIIKSPQNISRNKIVEVGNLASIDIFASRQLFKLLAFFLIKNNFRWVVFTGCQSLRLLFKKMRLKLITLGIADPKRIPCSLGNWGSYYKNNAQIMAGKLADGIFLANQADKSLTNEVM